MMLANDTRHGSYPAPMNPFGMFIPGTPENEAWTRGAERLLGAARDALRGQPGGDGRDGTQEMALPAPPGTAPQTPATAPQKDPLGRTISPRATMPPPGDCTPDQHRRLQGEVDAACEGVPRSLSDLSLSRNYLKGIPS